MTDSHFGIPVAIIRVWTVASGDSADLAVSSFHAVKTGDPRICKRYNARVDGPLFLTTGKKDYFPLWRRTLYVRGS